MGSADDEVARLPVTSNRNVTYADVLGQQCSGICSDYAEFYSPRGLTWLAAGLGAGALMANTGFDEHTLRDTYSENIIFAPSDEVYEKLHQPKFLGEGLYTIPVFAAAALAEPLIDDLPGGPAVAQWGQRSFRALAVGAPPLLALQVLTGGSRPGETMHGSHWAPLNDNNGVSGHSFMGAVPFMSAAKMTDRLWLKGGLYAASALPALSRVNDDDHYFSQAFLGWWLAYMAASAVDRSHDPDASYHFFAYPTQSGAGAGVEFEY